MAAFIGAVKVGAHALETDIHLSKDGVAVLSHVSIVGSLTNSNADIYQDSNLKRCFGRPEKVIDCDWELLSTVRTLQAGEPMPRLLDLLQYLAEPGLEDVWLLLDIKVFPRTSYDFTGTDATQLDNNADDVMRLIASTIDQVPAQSRPWKDRIVLGCWATKYLPLAHEYLPDYSITHIGFSTAYAIPFLSVPNISFNTLQHVLIGSLGASFIRKAKALNRPVFTWTVNQDKKMRWGIRHGLDGVITDDPKRFLEICKEWKQGDENVRESFTWREWFDIVRIQFFVTAFLFLFKWKFGWGIDKRFITRALVGKQ
jgi:glycerophosphoryl diester phosphodiesterase